ncbi:MAG: VCBS repeat-containing protein, partial [Planctomycetes bacterium]|nr:VCBS repeat-containing protein [Planctomycetota bacterium]
MRRRDAFASCPCLLQRESLENRTLLSANLTIDDVSIVEGNTGTKNAVFTVTRSGDDSLSAISFSYSTSDVTATAGQDYTAVSGVATIAGGATTTTISVPILSDTIGEYDEQFRLNLGAITNVVGPAITMSTKTDVTSGAVPIAQGFGDLNADGKPDLVIVEYGDNAIGVMFNTTAPGAATPTYSSRIDVGVGSLPDSVTFADFNGDGKLDVVVANSHSNTVSVLLNTTAPGAATATFAPRSDFSAGSRPYSVAVADINGDGRPD